MKKLKYWLITVFMLLPMMVSAYDFEMGGIYYNITSEDDLMVEVTYKSYYNSYHQGEIIIPSTVTYKEKAYSVASIGDEAFTECISLTSVTIPGSVKSIGAVSFANCYNLTSITIPESVTRIGDYAFYYCKNLTSITIPESVTRIGIEAFNYCTSLPIENHIYYADKWAVGVDDKTLVRYTLKSDTRGLSGTFEGCENLVCITIPESVTSIGAYTFMSTGLTSVTIPNSVTYIGESVFDWCSSLTSVHISDITAWCNITFANSYSNPLIYAHHLYKDGKEITNLEIPEGVTVINNSAFEGCTGLISVTIPNSVTSIGKYAFKGCDNLINVTVESNTPISLVNDATFTSSYKATLYVPLGCKDAYEQAQYWSNFREIVEIQPTEVTISINEYGSGTYSSEYALDFTKVEGMKAYVGVGFNTETMTLLMSAVKTTQPELGLYIKGAPGEYKVPIIEKSKENYINLLVGSVENTIVNKNSNDGKYTNYKYTMKTGDEGPRFYEFADGSTSKANKAYLQLPSEWISYISTSKSINLIFDDEEVTGINEFKTERPKNDNYMFDMQGRRVVNLSKGFYIVNGKKVVIK